MSDFHVGDVILYDYKKPKWRPGSDYVTWITETIRGRIVDIAPEEDLGFGYSFAVEFEEPFKGHSCIVNRKGKSVDLIPSGRGWFLNPNEIRKEMYEDGGLWV